MAVHLVLATKIAFFRRSGAVDGRHTPLSPVVSHRYLQTSLRGAAGHERDIHGVWLVETPVQLPHHSFTLSRSPGRWDGSPWPATRTETPGHFVSRYVGRWQCATGHRYTCPPRSKRTSTDAICRRVCHSWGQGHTSHPPRQPHWPDDAK